MKKDNENMGTVGRTGSGILISPRPVCMFLPPDGSVPKESPLLFQGEHFSLPSGKEYLPIKSTCQTNSNTLGGVGEIYEVVGACQ